MVTQFKIDSLVAIALMLSLVKGRQGQLRIDTRKWSIMISVVLKRDFLCIASGLSRHILGQPRSQVGANQAHVPTGTLDLPHQGREILYREYRR